MLVEFALVLPFLVLIFLGVVDYGSAFNDANRVDRAVLSAGRTVSSVADGRQADFATVQSLASSLETSSRVSIEKVIIYDSTAADGAVPANCLSVSTTGSPPFGVNGRCNVYTGAQVASATQASFAGTSSCTAGSWDRRWCPTSRQRDVNPDRVGVWVQVSYAPLTGLLPAGGLTVERSAIYQLEPTAAGS
ncbi:TadE/TadG family type IV pilus assembly protein [Rhabdothermincola salaria]|uniref:TadE/TadG family type IV pilus assembly protein n=1 Tax=Rhabdothermincola salaria TaxID=2903142 RepID=UPI001E5907C5|nr:pilus assembly protein [Rhabdothermincola salaria]